MQSNLILLTNEKRKFQQFKGCSIPQPIKINCSIILEPPCKVNIVLDLDLTLIEGYVETYSNHLDLSLYKDEDYNMQCFKMGDLKEIHIIERPGVKKFLSALSEFAHLYVYTNAVTEYAKNVLKYIDPTNEFIQKIVTREMADTPASPKDLRKLNLSENEIQNTLILDDQVKAWSSKFTDHVIPCSKFSPIQYDTNGSFFQEFSLYYSCNGEIGTVNFDCSKCKLFEKFTPKTSHLEITLLQLKSLYIEFCISNRDSFHDTYVARRKRILAGMKFSINDSVDRKLATSITKIIYTLGGSYESSAGGIALGNKPKIEHDIYYPVYCYLMLCKLPLKNYLVQ